MEAKECGHWGDKIIRFYISDFKIQKMVRAVSLFPWVILALRELNKTFVPNPSYQVAEASSPL